MKIKPQELTRESFADYGELLSIGKGAPLCANEEITYWGKISRLTMGADISTGLMITNRRAAVLTQMERHNETPEVLVAIEGYSVICFAAPTLPGQDISKIAAFHVSPGDAIALSAGTWHWAAYPLQTDFAKFIVMFADNTESSDLEVRELSEEITVEI